MRFPQIFSRSAPAPETKESATASVMVVNPGQAVWTPRDYEHLAAEAYVKNVIAFQSINKVGEAVGSVKWTAWRGDTEVTESPMLDLIRQPNPQQSYADLAMAKVGYKLLSGNSYEERVMVGAEPKELYTLRPDRMAVTLDASGQVSRYTYKVNGKETTWPGNGRDVDDILHSKQFHPTNDVYGLGSVEPGAFAIDQSNEGMAWMQALLQNSARPSGALVMQKDSGGSYQSLSDDNFNRLKAEVQDMYSGSGNAGKPMILEGGLDWKQMGLSPTDMGIIEGNNSAARNIALAFGVPPQLLGIPGDNTYSNYQEARLAFWEDSVIPMVMSIAAEWTRWLGPMFGGLELRADFDHIPAIADKRKTMFEMAQKATFLSLDERRELAGFTQLGRAKGGDFIQDRDGVSPAEPATSEDDIKAMAKLAGYEGKVSPLKAVK